MKLSPIMHIAGMKKGTESVLDMLNKTHPTETNETDTMEHTRGPQPSKTIPKHNGPKKLKKEEITNLQHHQIKTNKQIKKSDLHYVYVFLC